MRLLILFICFILSQARLSKLCESDVTDCQVSDFEFDKDFAPDGICGGISYMSGVDPQGKSIDLTSADDCGLTFSCQIVEPPKYKCSDMRLSIIRDACNQYTGTATCQYDHHKQSEVILGVASGVLALLLLLLLSCRYVHCCQGLRNLCSGKEEVSPIELATGTEELYIPRGEARRNRF
jgi:hypothetical protein